jgi:hypothetical protein
MVSNNKNEQWKKLTAFEKAFSKAVSLYPGG